MSWHGKPTEPPGFGDDGKYTVQIEQEFDYNTHPLGYLRLTATCIEGPSAGKSVKTRLLVDGVADELIADPNNKLGRQLEIGQSVMSTIIKLAGIEQPTSFDDAVDKFTQAIEQNNFELKQITNKAGYKNYYYEKALGKPARMVTGDPVPDKAPAKVPAKASAKGGDLLDDTDIPF